MKFRKSKKRILISILLLCSFNLFAEQDSTTKNDEDIEHFTVTGDDQLSVLRYNMYRAEEEFFDLFNQITTESDYKVTCEKKNRHGFTRIKQRDCQSNYETRIKHELTQRAINTSSKRKAFGDLGGNWMRNLPLAGELYAESKKIRKNQIKEFEEKILSSEELQKKFIKLHETKLKFEEAKAAN